MLHVTKDWGTEQWIVNESTHCGKLLIVSPQWQCSLHHHIEKDETFFVMRGPAVMQVEDIVVVAGYGESFRIPPGTKHRFAALAFRVKLMEFSSHHDDADVVRHEPTSRITDDMKRRIRTFYDR